MLVPGWGETCEGQRKSNENWETMPEDLPRHPGKTEAALFFQIGDLIWFQGQGGISPDKPSLSLASKLPAYHHQEFPWLEIKKFSPLLGTNTINI